MRRLQMSCLSLLRVSSSMIRIGIFRLGLFLLVVALWMSLIVGSNLAGHARLFAQVKDHLNHVVDGPVVVLSSNEVTNLQSLQKKVISGCLQVELNDEEEGEQTANVYLQIQKRLT